MRTFDALQRCILTLSLIALSGCSLYGLRGLEQNELPITKRSVFIDNNGVALQPKLHESATPFADDDYARYVGEIMSAIRTETRVVDGRKHILMRIHGGLNTLDGNLVATQQMNDSINADVAAGYFPIFVNWESGLVSSLGEHLFFNRRGQNYPLLSWAGLPASPIYLASDLVQGAGRIPITFTRQLHNFLSSPFANEEEAFPKPVAPPKGVEVPKSTKDFVRQSELGAITDAQANNRKPIVDAQGVVNFENNVTISKFAYKRSRWEAAGYLTSAIALTVPPNVYIAAAKSAAGHPGWDFSKKGVGIVGWVPLKPLAVYLVDALGGPSWDIMHRRTKSMFVNPNAISAQGLNASSPTRGGMVTLVDSIQQLIARDPTYELTIVGHSMGAIVLSELLRNEMIRDDRPQLEVANVVFMASAASMREFQSSVLPYLERHPNTQFYNLTLHEYAENRESNMFNIAPNGSLLQYIDSYLSRPETDMDRMIGKYENSVASLYIYPPSVRGRVHIKGFGYNDGSGCGTDKAFPYKHGQFNELSVPFWRPNFWHPGVKGCEDNKKDTPTVPSQHNVIPPG